MLRVAALNRPMWPQSTFGAFQMLKNRSCEAEDRENQETLVQFFFSVELLIADGKYCLSDTLTLRFLLTKSTVSTIFDR